MAKQNTAQNVDANQPANSDQMSDGWSEATLSDEPAVAEGSSRAEAAPAADPIVATSPDNVLNTPMTPDQPTPTSVDAAEPEADSGTDAPAAESEVAPDAIESKSETPVESATSRADADAPAQASTSATFEEFSKKFWAKFDEMKQVLAANFLKAKEWIGSKLAEAGAENQTEASADPETSGTSPAPSTPPAAEGTSAPESSSASPAETSSAAPDNSSAPEGAEQASEKEAKNASESEPVTERSVVEGELIEEPASTSKQAQSAANDEEIIDVEFESVPRTDQDAEVSSTSTEAPVAAPTASSAASTATEKAVEQNKPLDPAALKDIGTKVQAKLTELRETTVPRTITLTMVTDDADAFIKMAALIKESKGEIQFAFDGQIKNVAETFEALGKIDLVKPQTGSEFRRAQVEGLRKISGLIESHRMLEKNMKAFGERQLPDSIKEGISHSISELGRVRAELEKAREMIANARRTNPTKAATEGASPSGTEAKVEVKTGSIMGDMPKLEKLSIKVSKLETMGHAMVDANIADKELNAQYKAVMSEFVRSYVRTFSNIRKEIYQSRMDGKTLDEMQTERLRYLADELGQEAKVSDLVQLDYGKLSQPFTEELDSRFRRVIDASKFQRALNQMKAEFAAALTKELDKKPGTENTDSTYVAFKREKFEKTEGFAKYEEIERKVEEAKELTEWLSKHKLSELRKVRDTWGDLSPEERQAVDAAIKFREERYKKRSQANKS